MYLNINRQNLNYIVAMLLSVTIGFCSTDIYFSILFFLLIALLVALKVYLINPFFIIGLIMPIEVIGPLPQAIFKFLKIFLLIILGLLIYLNYYKKMTIDLKQKSNFSPFVFLFILFSIISSLMSPDILLSLSKVFQYLIVFFVYLLMSKTNLEKKEQKKVIDYFITGAVFSCLIGICQYAFNVSWLWPDAVIQSTTGTSRITAFFNNTNGFAGYLSLIFPILIIRVFISSQEYNLKTKFFNIIVLLLMLIAIFLSKSSGALISVFISTIVIILSRTISFRRALIISTPGFILLLILLTNIFNNSIFHIVKSILISQNRLFLWEATIKIIRDHPWFGIGFYNFYNTLNSYGVYSQWGQEWPHPHNVFLDIIVCIGLSGLVVLILIIYKVIKGLLQIDKNKNIFSLGVYSALIGGLFHDLVDSGYFIGTSSVATTLWILLGLIENTERRNGSGV
ncbi:O-antigen ligase family protein [Fictibacillus terranigra]|uniref:O-antigen ligase family protein n=1 Tax=Fictibacillus terranigra TaxID=3058424 RepID=A0ABT8E1G8_9BACL|nr:O-antigen ligase family protein [Fictibacillus sp. CENA-BCM004]MDN4071762.1 O-antigen ligase family protein [Fictibacillus sp. CENA-BCM004]